MEKILLIGDPSLGTQYASQIAELESRGYSVEIVESFRFQQERQQLKDLIEAIILEAKQREEELTPAYNPALFKHTYQHRIDKRKEQNYRARAHYKK